MMTVMRNPTVLSSGVIMDKEHLYDHSGKIKYNECPLTRQKLKMKAYPVTMIKAKVIDFYKERL